MGELVSGPLIVGLPIAILAGLVSFLSPCILPLVPGYLGYVGGLASGDGPRDRRRLVLGVLLFVLGFTLVFAVANVAASGLGIWLAVHRDLVTRVAGVVVIALGLVFIGVFGIAQRTVKPGWQPRTGLAGAPLLGIVFGVGWTPCLGPTLTTITALSLDSGSVVQGAVLGVAYSLGLGIPFLLVALGLGWVTGGVAWVRRHIRLVNIAGGVLLVVVGLLMVTGLWTLVMTDLEVMIDAWRLPL